MPETPPPSRPPGPPGANGAAPSAAVLLIGNELLTGKIRDANGWHLTRFLRRRGIQLLEICVIPDDDARIGEALLRLASRADLVFTSGGVGPTHDDRTLPAIATATGRPLARHAGMEDLLQSRYGGPLTDEALAMADLPAGTVPCALPGWPVLRLDLTHPRPCRVYMLPGVPELLRAKLERLEQLPGELPHSGGWSLETLDVTLDESRLTAHLEEIVSAFPTVEVGSYPRWVPDATGRLRARVHITFEAEVTHANHVSAARNALRAALPDAVVARGTEK